MLIIAGSGRERHTYSSRALGIWTTPANVVIIGAGGGYRFSSTASSGGSPSSVIGSKAWWSLETPPPSFTTGTYVVSFKLFGDSSGTPKQRYLAWKSSAGQLYLALCSDTAGTELLTTQVYSGSGNALLKIEYDSGVWSIWSKMGSGTSWQLDGTYTETSPTTPYTFQITPNGATDEKSGIAVDYYNLLMWDTQGTDWNSRIATMSDFPKISVAHFLTTPEETASQAVLLDEVVPASDFASATSTGYYATPPALDASVTETIQAVMVTLAEKTADITKVFNLREGGVLDQKTFAGGSPYTGQIQQGSFTSGGVQRSTYATYWPWTPAGKLWTPNRFAGTGGESSMEYGVGIVNGVTDQITVQVISFGSAAEWNPPGAARRRYGAFV